MMEDGEGRDPVINSLAGETQKLWDLGDILPGGTRGTRGCQVPRTWLQILTPLLTAM